jgi:hypothetical protein
LDHSQVLLNGVASALDEVHPVPMFRVLGVNKVRQGIVFIYLCTDDVIMM